MRLQKVLAAAGVGSRRACERLILEGRIEVEGLGVAEIGVKVDPRRQKIRVDGEPLARPKLVYYMLHKPQGVVSTARDPAGRPRVIDLVPGEPRVFPVGRLDLYSEGLILLTNDGELSNRLTHPSFEVEKVYHVLAAGQIGREDVAGLRKGVHLSDGFVRPKRLRIKTKEKKNTWLELVLDEGRNREIRRLLAAAGHKVLRLRRVAVGPLRLGDLPAGAYRPLGKEEIKSLHQAVR